MARRMILITGAGGFVGRGLVLRLLARGEALTLVDTHGLDEWAGHPNVTSVLGSIADRALLTQALAGRPQTVFHLASVPGGRAEQDYTLGRSVNLDATLALLERLAEFAPVPVLVFASSIAVFGGPLPDPVSEHQPPRPLLSYGAQKLVGEVLIADFARRGWVDGRSVRLSGIVTRPSPPPGQAAGAISIFLSDLIRDLPRGLPVTVPMSPGATTWLTSLTRTVDNLLWAASMSGALPAARVWTPPPLCVGMAELVEAIGVHHGRDLRSLVRYAPVAAVEAAFGASPPLLAPESRAAGFQDDGTLAALIARASDFPPSGPASGQTQSAHMREYSR